MDEHVQTTILKLSMHSITHVQWTARTHEQFQGIKMFITNQAKGPGNPTSCPNSGQYEMTKNSNGAGTWSYH